MRCPTVVPQGKGYNANHSRKGRVTGTLAPLKAGWSSSCHSPHHWLMVRLKIYGLPPLGALAAFLYLTASCEILITSKGVTDASASAWPLTSSALRVILPWCPPAASAR